MACGLTAAALIAAITVVPARPQAPVPAVPVAALPATAATSEREGAAAIPRVGAGCVGMFGSLSGTAVTVVDGRTFRFTDGREIRLAAIETPPIASADEDAARAGLAAKAALEALVLHRALLITPALAAPDRYGRLVGYAFTTEPEAFVQHDMLAQGYALLSPAAVTPRCAGILRGAERRARTAELGLWGEPYFAIRPADDPAVVLAEQGRFVLVGGKVESVRESGGIVYVNFGRRWSEDFTVTILKRNERLFAGAGLAPRRLAGRWIEVRGFIEERGGPAIEAARPEQIELIEAARQ